MAAGLDHDTVDEGVGEVVVGSLQPNHPGVSQGADDVEKAEEDVIVGAGVALEVVVVVVVDETVVES